MAHIDCPVFMTICPKIMKLGDLRHKTMQDSKYGIQFADRAMPDCGNRGRKASSSVLTSFSSYATK